MGKYKFEKTFKNGVERIYSFDTVKEARRKLTEWFGLNQAIELLNSLDYRGRLSFRLNGYEFVLKKSF